MRENDLISVILPIYNVEPYLERAVDSIIKQTYRNIEIILVDDGSPDNCGNICDAYAKQDKRIIVIHKENGGLSDARNVGIKKASGKYITLVDSDDYVDDDYVEFLYSLIKNSGADMSICSHTVLYDNGTILTKATHELCVLDKKKVLERILYDDGIDLSAWAKMYDAKLFENVQYPKRRLFEDAATTYLLVDQCRKIAFGSESKYYYMIRSNSITTNNFSSKKLELITSTQEMTEYIKNKYPDLGNAADRRLMYAYLSTLSQLANCSERHLEEERFLIDYVKKNGLKFLKNKKVKKRDKFGIITAIMGFPIYKVSWNLYRKVTGRK